MSSLSRLSIIAAILCGLVWGAASPAASNQSEGSFPTTTRVMSLDGPSWLIAHDPDNLGKKAKWMETPPAPVRKARVPWIAQDTFPNKHGVFWYWRDFEVPANPRPQGRTLLRFWAVDYKAEVWLNGTAVGGHEGGETPFVLDVTAAVKPGAVNRLAVRVLNPTHQRIDGIVLNETAHRNKTLPYAAGNAWDQGGIIDSVELLLAPAVRLDDLFVRADSKTGTVRIQVAVHSSVPAGTRGVIEFIIASAAGGEVAAIGRVESEFTPGSRVIETRLEVPQPHMWDLNNPFLYRVTARLHTVAPPSSDEFSVRCGFRDFRVQNGAFRLNGRRLYLRCSHTGNCCPIGLELPHDPDLLRRDLLNSKVMGFNAIRFISGVARRYQLDLCDEIGLMVYEEAYASWCLADSPQMAQRYDESILGMVRRDRNHPSVVMWGLLNETPDGAVFRHAASVLPALRALDDSRIVMLNSGHWDNQGGTLTGLEAWRPTERVDPCVSRNPTSRTIKGLGITWAPGQLSFHPGEKGEYAVVRWTAPAEDKIDLEAVFTSIAEHATTDVHVLHNDKSLFDDFVNVNGRGPQARFRTVLTVKAGDTLDCALGFGNGNYGADTTALALVLKSASGKTYDAAREFSIKNNPNGVWSYGLVPPGPGPDTTRFTRFTWGQTLQPAGTFSNPGSTTWENLIDDRHPYQRVPHTAGIIRALRTCGAGGPPLFLSEYGIGSGIDLLRVTRHYERLGATHAMDAQFYRERLDHFLADWQRWHMAEAFGRPEDFFRASLSRMAGQRLLGLNAIRANPNVIGHSLTGTVDQGMTAEGLWTTFREFKPGTADALFDGWAPLRLCLFVEPVNVYRGTPLHLEAVLANEDALPAGEYPIRLHVFGPNERPVLERRVMVKIGKPGNKPEPSFALPVFAETVSVDGPAGKYRFVVSFERGAAATGGETEFYLDDPATMPQVATEVVVWGEDEGLTRWLTGHGIRVKPFAGKEPVGREVILGAARAPAPGGPAAFRDLAGRIARGATVIFLSPTVFAHGGKAEALVPLAGKGSLTSKGNWLYHADQWAKPHPVFTGLPTGLLDYTFYRELVPDRIWSGLENPAEAVAGANNTSIDYSSGLLLSIHNLGAGRFILTTLPIRENLGTHPAAERLLRNLLHHAARDIAKPLADLPPDFAQQLSRWGY